MSIDRGVAAGAWPCCPVSAVSGTCAATVRSHRDPPSRKPPLKTALIPVRLERTREVLRELLRSLKEALPIVAGVAGPIFLAGFALLAWAGVPPMLAVTLPWRSGAALWIAHTGLAAWPLWALRGRLLPQAWCVQLRCLPLTARALWLSDLAVSAVILAPLAGLYALSVAVFGWQRPAWWLQAMPWTLLSLLASWASSCALGAGALAWQRRGVGTRVSRAMRVQAPATLLAARPGPFFALLWWPGWRGALTPGFASVLAGMGVAVALAVAWTQSPWPVIPGAAWALVFSMLSITLTERVQRTMEAHLAALTPWLTSLPTSPAWRWRARLLVCAPMVLAGLVALLLVMASRPWRAWPLAAFAIGLVATPLALTAVPSANREAHVGLWAFCTGLLTAFGSELWN